MSLTIRVLIALVAGFGAGLGLAEAGGTIAATVASALQPVGTMWVAAIRMPIVPLVVSSLLIGVGGASDTGAIGRLGARGMALFLLMLTVAALMSALVAPAAIGAITIDPEAAKALRESAAGAAASAVEGAKQIPSMAQWFVDLVPSNPLKAAVDGALLPVIVFSIALGAGLTRVDAKRRAALLDVMEAVQGACLVVMRVVLALAPIGVFALAFVLATRLGLAAAGAIAAYIAVVTGLSAAYCVGVLYPAAATFGGVPYARFARAIVPAQAVAVSSRSSLAAFPAMIQIAREQFKLGEATIGFLLPLMITIFRAGVVFGQMIGAIFIAKLYGIPLSTAQYATIAATSIAASFSVPGIPGGGIIMMVPVLMSVGLPAEGVGVLLAVDTIPDMFRTTTNVTADLTAAVILDRRSRTA